MQSAPSAPDPQETAAASMSTNYGTAAANAALNNVNQITPDGSIVYNRTGTYKQFDPYTNKEYEVPQFTMTQTLSPEQMEIKKRSDQAKINLADLASEQSGRLKDVLGKPLSIDNAPAAGDPSTLTKQTYQDYGSGPNLINSYDDYSGDRKRVEDALMERLNPSLDRDEESLRTRLANQGIQIGSAAYQSAMGDSSRARNDARLGVILNAGNEQTRLQGLARDRAGFSNDASQQTFQNQFNTTGAQNTIADKRFSADQAMIGAMDDARAKYLNEQYASRNQPINEIAALMSGSQVTNPNFISQGRTNIANTDTAGIINRDFDNRFANYSQKSKSQNDLIGGILGATAKVSSAALGGR